MADKTYSEKITKIAEQIEQLTAVELAELAEYMEDKFGVQPMAVAASATPTAPTGQEAPAEEKSSFTVVLAEAGANKLNVVKAVRELKPDLGLMDAKKLVDSAPKEILVDVKKEEAENAKQKLEAAGAKVELK
ncbi:MAG: 50S ribosomal protein L7/L12 [Patescibacteria group bacterium]|nr:MAG: 50S ribosomal protein L7/L12 [Patescibacteria group bacterium]